MSSLLRQPDLFESHDDVSFVPDRRTHGNTDPFLCEQLITYIGNKRSLLPFIGVAVDRVRDTLGRNTLATADLFSGSGIVARYLKGCSHCLIANDLELYSEAINRCYLSNRAERDEEALRRIHRDVTGCLQRDEHADALDEGIIARNYAPADEENIGAGDRVFYTRRNARYIDTARRYIDSLAPHYRPFLLAPLLAAASVHANTAGVFKGFYKDSRTGVGRYGGTGADALSRITGNISLDYPVFSSRDCRVTVYREDANELAGRLAREDETLDLVYLDPPYNQHPYGSNYFMLNVIAHNEEPRAISRVSGIPADWNRSAYNSALRAESAFRDLVHSLNTRFILVSFNNEGFLAQNTIVEILQDVGAVEVLETRYNTFRGSRNLHKRSAHVKEYLFLVDTRVR